ncbi:MAG: hypothetical protein R2818_07435 [Flavobacteriales bacterium]
MRHGTPSGRVLGINDPLPLVNPFGITVKRSGTSRQGPSGIVTTNSFCGNSGTQVFA